MRIPIPIVVISCLIACAVVWYTGTRDKDFITPPNPGELVEVAKKWEESRPNIPPPKPIDPGLLRDGSSEGPMIPSSPERTPVEVLPAGNLSHSPALTTYGTHGDKGSEAMINLATSLETQGQLQRALLAWERVIDTTGPSDEERAFAVKAIKRLKTSLPPWNPDPSDELVITLRAGATLKDKEVLIQAMEKVATSISETSGFILRVETQASIGKVWGSQRTPRVPVAIWFSRNIGDSDATAETPPISFMADPQQEAMLVAQIEAGAYALIRAHLASKTGFSPLPEYPAGAKPTELLTLHITRLMWREFATSMKE